jgi:hypothetical protein
LSGGTYSSTGGVVSGALPHTDPSGVSLAYISRFSCADSTTSSSQNGILVLADRLWDNGGITVTITTVQTVNSVAWPARDNTGTTNGAGVLIGVEAQSAITTLSQVTVNYTNSSGTSGRSAVVTAGNVTALQTTGGVIWMPLQAGDIGVQSVQSIQLGTNMVAGTINMVAFRVLEVVEQASGFTGKGNDCIRGGFQRIYNGAVPFIMMTTSSTAAGTIHGTYIEAQG